MSESLSREATARFIEDHYVSRASELSLLTGGEWSQAYGFNLDGQECVVRFGAYGEDFAKDQIMSCHSSEMLPIPRVLEVGETPAGYFAVSERAHGVMVDDLDEKGMRKALPALLTAVDTCGKIDISDHQGYGIWKPDEIAPYKSWPDALLSIAEESERTAGWRALLAESAVGPAAFDTGYQKLGELATGLPEARQIIHGDLLHSNVLVQDSRISAVLDWGNALYGDALYDAAWLIYWWQWYPAWKNIDIRGELDRHWSAGGSTPANVEHRLHCYQLHIGLDAMTYDAFTRRWGELDHNARKVSRLVSPGAAHERDRSAPVSVPGTPNCWRTTVESRQGRGDDAPSPRSIGSAEAPFTDPEVATL